MDLLPADARFDSLTDNADGTGGFAAGDPGGANAQGLTFNVTFTPTAADLDPVVNPLVSSNAMNILEVGGDANGSGLYLFDGELHFISKMNGGVGNVPNLFNDLNFSSGNNMIGVRSSFGPLIAGTEYSVAVVFDPLTTATIQLGILPTGGSLSTESYTISGVGTRTNWSGDDSVTALRGANANGAIANFGGANTAGGDTWSEALINANGFNGTAGQALYWSANGTIVPEPSGSLLAVLAVAGFVMRRRR